MSEAQEFIQRVRALIEPFADDPANWTHWSAPSTLREPRAPKPRARPLDAPPMGSAALMMRQSVGEERGPPKGNPAQLETTRGTDDETGLREHSRAGGTSQ